MHITTTLYKKGYYITMTLVHSQHYCRFSFLVSLCKIILVPYFRKWNTRAHLILKVYIDSFENIMSDFIYLPLNHSVEECCRGKEIPHMLVSP